MKRLITLSAIVAILLLAIFPVFSYASHTDPREANITFTANKTKVSKGDTVTFSVRLDQIPSSLEGIYGAGMIISYDGDFFGNFNGDDANTITLEDNRFYDELTGEPVYPAIDLLRNKECQYYAKSFTNFKPAYYSFTLDVKADTTLSSGVVTLTDDIFGETFSSGSRNVRFAQESYSLTVSIDSETHDEPDDPTPPPSTVAVSGVSVNPTSKELKVGETITVKATVTPSNATNKAVTWASSNPSVASVSSSGVVTAKEEGAAAITAKTNDGNYTASCMITVVKASSPDNPSNPDNPSTEVKVTGVAIDKPTASVKVGGKLQLSATVAPAAATNKSVTWTSSDTSIATVSTSGLVTGVKEGTAKITVKTVDGGMTAVATIIVTNDDVVINIEDNKSSSGGSSSSSSSSSSKSGSDSTTAKDKIPQTGETFLVAAGIIALSSVAIVSYKKMKANKDI